MKLNFLQTNFTRILLIINLILAVIFKFSPTITIFITFFSFFYFLHEYSIKEKHIEDDKLKNELEVLNKKVNALMIKAGFKQ